MDDETFDDSKWFVVSFCCEGLEGVIPVTDLEAQDTFDILQGKPATHRASQAVNHMILRARFNPQRYYEIYAISATSGITAEDITSLFEMNPQHAADLIRDRGQKLFSDRPRKDNRVIK